MKSIGLLMMLSAGIATAAYLPTGDSPTGDCPGKCSQSDTTACGSCSDTAAQTVATTACEGCPSTKLTSKGEATACEGCPSTKLTSKGEAKGCAACAAGEKCTTCTAGEKSCEGCPSTKLTSKGEAKGCAACAAGEKCTTCTAGEKCEGCPSTKATSAGAAACTTCPDGKCTGSCAKDTTVATSAKPADGATCTGSCGADCSECPITAAMAKLPQMAYMVGTEKVCCPNAASELAKKSDAKVKFVVAEKSFEKEGEAKLALVEATEQFVSAFAKPQVCKESGTITVAGQKACCAGSAAQLAKTATAAIDKVQMTYAVGEKACNCPVEAEKLAKDSGDVKLFVVGEEKTACNVTARLNLARAKYKAAVVAMMQATSETKETSTETSKDS